MTTAEQMSSSESAMENEINTALDQFSQAEKKLKNEVLKDNKDLKAWTKAEMQAYLDSGELKKRIDGYIQVNGTAINVDKIAMDDASGLLTVKYKIDLNGEQKAVTSFFQIMGETNNTYLQFKNNPKTNTEVT